MTGTVIKNVAEFNGKHSFLGEEILVPMVNKNDCGRINLFCNHIGQAVVLNNPERPRVFSNFENVFGSYTTAIQRLPHKARVLSVFENSPLQKIYALLLEDGSPGGRAHIHFANPVRHLTENYGYLLRPLDDVYPGDVIEKGRVIQSWPCHDDLGNFGYGVNLRALYTNEARTYEDGIVISASAADKLSHTAVEKIVITLNQNDLMLNLYGENEDDYAGFPEVGHEIRNGILLARRRINHESVLYNLSDTNLSAPNWSSDTIFYANGTVVGVEIFSNIDEAGLDRHPHNMQLLRHYRQWLAYKSWFKEHLAPYVEKGKNYTDEVAYRYKVYRDNEKEDLSWRKDKIKFDGVTLRIMVAQDKVLSQGSKITNRYGGKGVISAILPDEEMPKSVDGRSVDVIINALGVLNRMNMGQLFEQELNFIAEEVIKQMKGMPSTEDAYQHLKKFLTLVSPTQAKWIDENLSEDDKLQMTEEIIGGIEDIYIHQPPFWENISVECLNEAYETFNVNKVKMIGMEDPKIIGHVYFMKLRHEALGKFSARSAKHLTIGGVPGRNSRGVHAKFEHHSSTPIRLGEQEIQNLLISNDSEGLRKFLAVYSTDEAMRAEVIKEIITRPDPFSTEEFKEIEKSIPRPVAGLTALLETIGLELTHEDEEETSED